MRRAALGVFVWLTLASSIPSNGLAEEDLYRQPACLAGAAADSHPQSRSVLKLLRWPYALEQPFHLLPQEPFGDAGPLQAPTRLLFHGHSGLVLEGPGGDRWEADFQLQAGFTRGPDPGSPLCLGGEPFRLPEARITIDPFTGNLFVGRYREPWFELTIFDRGGAPLAEVRTDLFFRSVLPDLSGGPHTEIDRAVHEEYFWLDTRRLAGFVEVYRRVGGSSYARFVVDAFVAESILRERADRPGGAGPRLPYLPVAERALEGAETVSIDNLRGLRTTYRQAFVRGRPRKGGVSCAVMPVLKMLEDRDCRDAAQRIGAGEVARNGCPAYSAMALQTELFRRHPESLRHRGYALFQVFETAARRGLCLEEQYPMLRDVALGRTAAVEQFAARAEHELERILRERDGSSREEYAGFLRRTRGRDLKFVDLQPEQCHEAMRAYREQQPRAPHDLVDLLATQGQFRKIASEPSLAQLQQAQRDELQRLVLELLRRGLLVGVAGDRGSLRQHAVLAYGLEGGSLLLMDSDLPDEAARRRSLLAVDELRRTIAGVSFLRDEVATLPPTEPQLIAASALLPDLAWIQRWLAQLRREEGRHREALEPLRRLVAREPKRVDAWLDLAGSLQALGRFGEAEAATRRAIAAGGNDRYAQAQLGYSLRKLGRLEEAERALRIAVSERHAWEWQQLGWTLFDAGRDAEAESCFRRAVEIEPLRVESYLRLAEFLTYAGRPEAARTVLGEAERRGFGPRELAWIGNWLGVLGRLDEAVPLLETVLAQAPDDVLARLALARLQRRMGDESALARTLEPLLDRAVDEAARGGEAGAIRMQRAYAQALIGDRAACRETVEAIEARHDELAGAELYDLACVLALNGDADRALELLDEAFRRGYDDYRWARRDPDWNGLAGDPRLEPIRARYGSHER
jgi:tetratricopeptide (TPR) repeat protein